jgi:ATP-binding cassette subfamily B protein
MLPTKLPAFFWHFARHYKFAFFMFFFAPFLVGMMEANVQPYAIKMIIDAIAVHTGPRQEIFTQIFPGLLLFTGAIFIIVITSRFQQWLQSRVVPRFQAEIRMQTLAHMTKHSYQYFTDNPAGGISNKINDLVRTMFSITLTLAWGSVLAAGSIVAAFVIMATIDYSFLVILGIWVPSYIAVSVYYALKVNRSSAINAENKSSLVGDVVDTIANILSVKLFAKANYELKHIEDMQIKEIESHRRNIITSNWMNFSADISIILLFFPMFTNAIYGWVEGRLSSGDLTYIILASMGITHHMWWLAHNITTLFSDIGIANQALKMLKAPVEVVDHPEAVPLQVTRGKIEFLDVTFHYIRNNNIFNHKNVTIEAGSKVGLVGFSGSGKTTFARLLLRFYDVAAGQIKIDGQDISTITQDSLREQIAMIPQDVSLFHRSLMENIRYGRMSASDEEVIAAAKQAHAHEFIETLPDGYNTLVGERGVKLSGGQRQRIAIARAILKDAPILVLDEATSALDSVTESKIQSILAELMQNRTTIVIAHRLSTLEEVDRILVFDQGYIVEDGSHAELMQLNRHYAQMWRMQAGGFLPEKDKEEVPQQQTSPVT